MAVQSVQQFPVFSELRGRMPKYSRPSRTKYLVEATNLVQVSPNTDRDELWQFTAFNCFLYFPSYVAVGFFSCQKILEPSRTIDLVEAISLVQVSPKTDATVAGYDSSKFSTVSCFFPSCVVVGFPFLSK